jgi:predicted ABC-type sugar transport system permease subunit
MNQAASNAALAKRSSDGSIWASLRRSMPTLEPLLALIILTVIFSLLNSNFFSLRNATNILQQAAVLTVLALGETFVIPMGSIDRGPGGRIAPPVKSGRRDPRRRKHDLSGTDRRSRNERA